MTDIAGPVCETGDYLALARALPELQAGDLISVMTAGAYGAVLASEYNSRLLVPEVLVSGNRYSVTRPRPSYGDMLAKERLPEWLLSRSAFARFAPQDSPCRPFQPALDEDHAFQLSTQDALPRNRRRIARSRSASTGACG